VNEKEMLSQVELVQDLLGGGSDETDLKAERVQESLAAGPDTAGLKAERVQELLQALPGWRLAPGGQAIDKMRMFTDPGVAEAYAIYVSRLARSKSQAVAIDHAASHVMVTIYGKMHEICVGELSEETFDLAAAIG
jgi:pterin-4a-carbinolamine dehydratase